MFSSSVALPRLSSASVNMPFCAPSALAPLSDGRALFIYNQRKHGDPGVWLAIVRPTDHDFSIEAGELTSSLKLRRKEVTAKHLALLESFYTDHY